MESVNQALLTYIENSPTAFHAVENLRLELEAAGYRELREQDDWTALPERFFVRRNGSSLIALQLPQPAFEGFLIMAAHADSPCFKLKEKPELKGEGYTRLSVEKYGGLLCAPWLDRPLSVAGRVAVRDGERVSLRLVDFKRDLALIPNLAIHMDRGANENKSYNVNTDMLPVLGSAELQRGLDALLAGELGVKEEDILSRELLLYPRTPGSVWGAEEEFLSSPRLDDLQCVFGCLKGFLAAEPKNNAAVLCVFDNEEVGSGTKQGADSSFLEDVLSRTCEALGRGPAGYRAAVARSFLVSADNAHALHPNHPEFADKTDRPLMNGGVVIKSNANQKYTTDALSAAVFSEICRRAGVPTQRFTNRADLPGGSTLGNISTAHVSLNSVDIGLAQLAMHSCCETAGARDTDYLIRAAEAFYSSGFRLGEGGIEL